MVLSLVLWEKWIDLNIKFHFFNCVGTDNTACRSECGPEFVSDRLTEVQTHV